MNRYTFKAKRKDTGEWVYGYYVMMNEYETIYDFCGEINTIIPKTLCQCTGLENFYEHDLVKYEDEDEIYEIIWFDEDCYFGLKGKGNRDTEMLYYKDIFKYLKLLGNKFDKEED